MTITEVSHAVRCLESWVKQGEQMLKDVSGGPWKVLEQEPYPSFDTIMGPSWHLVLVTVASNLDMNDYINRKADASLIARSRSFVPGLVEGVVAVLKQWYRVDAALKGSKGQVMSEDLNGYLKGSHEQMQLVIHALAKALAPRMVEAGMTVPK